jgi:hypothetical protein
MNNIQLHVGYIGITREGKRVEIIERSYDMEYPWNCKDTDYTDTGGYSQSRETNNDIIGPWVETPVEPQVNYNDGNWHRWDGATAECPVHKDSTVEVTYMDQDAGIIIDSRYARNYCWNSGHGPILAFRVTREYVAPVEPREFWVVPATGKCFISKPAYTPAIHVREVI